MASIVNYFTDNKNKVVCEFIIPFTSNESICGSFKGVAKCSPNDEFNFTTGCELAYERALLKVKRAEVNFHTKRMHELKIIAQQYEKHIQAIEHNKRRVAELREEIKDLATSI